jgi:hypothetical protein
MSKWRKAIIAGLLGAATGAAFGAIAATAATRNRLDFDAIAPAVILLELTNIDTSISDGASRPTADILIPANAVAYAMFFALFGILFYLRREEAARAPRYPEGLSFRLALAIAACCFPVLLLASGAAILFVVMIVASGIRGYFIFRGTLAPGLAIVAAFSIAYFWTRSIYDHLRWRKGGRDYLCCLKCGYNLTGNVSGICPECGTAIGET